MNLMHDEFDISNITLWLDKQHHLENDFQNIRNNAFPAYYGIDDPYLLDSNSIIDGLYKEFQVMFAWDISNLYEQNFVGYIQYKTFNSIFECNKSCFNGVNLLNEELEKDIFPITYISEIAVTTEYANKGIGKILFERTLRDSKNNNIGLFTRVNRNNEDSVMGNFVQRMGFNEVCVYSVYEDSHWQYQKSWIKLK